MASNSSTTPLKYTGLTHIEIDRQIRDRLRSNSNLDNFRESSVSQTQLEIFSAAADMINYYTERQAEESFFPTMKRLSSAINASRHFAYVVTRPVPASTKISITLKGDLYGKVSAGDRIQIPVFSRFSFGSTNLVLKRAFTYTFTESDAQSIQDDRSDYEKTISSDDNGEDIELIEGSIKEIIVEGASNPFVGQIFQSYRISDSTFSNLYGDADLENFPITNLWVGNAKTDANKYIINRRSLLNDDTIAGVIAGNPIKCAVVRTAVDGGVDVMFGDAKVAELGATYSSSGPTTTFDNIYLEYLSTIGSKANLVGIIGERTSYSGSIVVGTQNISSQVQFNLTENITGGTDIESLDSIRMSTPAIYYSLDRLVSQQDYVNYLKSLTSPINIRNALAWGEQQEAEKRNVDALIQMFNVGLFTCVGELYIIEGDEATATYTPRTEDNRLNESILDADPNEDGLAAQSYFNIYAKENVVSQLKTQEVRSAYYRMEGYAIGFTIDSLKAKYQGSIENTVYGKSDKFLSDTSLPIEAQTITASISIDIDGTSSMAGVASVIQEALRGVIDDRSYVVNGVEINGNLNQPAFPGITVSWDSVTKKFTAVGDPSDACYFYYNRIGNFLADAGFNDTISQKLWTNLNYSYISDKVAQVLALINKRAQITMKHVYVSPIIHNFDLYGKIYVNQLFDKEEVRREVNNSVYEFLNDNSDFNSSVFLSNLIDKIEENPGINNADVRLRPNEPSNPSVPEGRTVNFYPIQGSYNRFNEWSQNTARAILLGVATEIYSYLGYNIIGGTYNPLSIIDVFFILGSNWTDYLAINWAAFIKGGTTTAGITISGITDMTPDQIYASSTYGAYTGSDGSIKTDRMFNEWKFITGFMKDIYDFLVTSLGESGTADPNYTKFQDSEDFRLMMSDIHKDVSWIIRSLMLDKNNNIDYEYVKTTNQFGPDSRTYVRGGYSMGSEIPKITVTATYEYRT